jgi:invasion protein IalB
MTRLAIAPLLLLAAAAAPQPATEPTTQPASQPATQPASAGDEAPAKTWTLKQSFGPWEVRCPIAAEGEAAKPCAAVLEFQDTKSGATLLAWTVAKANAGALSTRFLTPTGVRIEPGVVLQLEGGEPTIRFLYQSCWTGGCAAGGDVPAELAAKIAAAAQANAQYTRLDGQNIRFDFKMDGLKAALDALNP